MLCGDRAETVDHISEYRKLAQKEYKNRHHLVEKVIHWELCKKMKFHHTDKFYKHKSESILKNEMHKILWDFGILTNHLIQARKPDLVLINQKKRMLSSRFCHPSKPLVEREERQKAGQIPGPCWRAEKVVKHKGDHDTNHRWSTRNSH